MKSVSLMQRYEHPFATAASVEPVLYEIMLVCSCCELGLRSWTTLANSRVACSSIFLTCRSLHLGIPCARRGSATRRHIGQWRIE